jgi:hypothetical protein
MVLAAHTLRISSWRLKFRLRCVFLTISSRWVELRLTDIVQGMASLLRWRIPAWQLREAALLFVSCGCQGGCWFGGGREVLDLVGLEIGTVRGRDLEFDTKIPALLDAPHRDLAVPAVLISEGIRDTSEMSRSEIASSASMSFASIRCSRRTSVWMLVVGKRKF